MVDFHTPGGVDRDGWQYAVDFPASYHAKKNFTDYVRRRRWFVLIFHNNGAHLGIIVLFIGIYEKKKKYKLGFENVDSQRAAHGMKSAIPN